MNNLIQTIKQLISIQSISEKPDNLLKVVDLSEKYLSSENIVIRRFLFKDKPSLVATMSQTKTPSIMLNGHLDVVPAKTEQFIAKTTNDKLYARGAYDMKAACSVMMKVFKDLSQDKYFPKNKLGLMLVTDEEIGGFNGSKILLKRGYKADFVMTGESTNFDIEVAAKGVLWLRLLSKGKSAHGAYLWHGKNAILSMSNAIQKINSLFPIPTKEIWKTTCNLANIHGGKATNSVPDTCELKLDIRYIPQDSMEVIVKNIKKAISGDIKVEIILKESSLQTNSKHPYIKLLKHVVQSETGKIPKLIKKHGASDARFFSEIGIPTTSFGPVGSGLHSDNEWVSMKSVTQYENILSVFLRKL